LTAPLTTTLFNNNSHFGMNHDNLMRGNFLKLSKSLVLCMERYFVYRL